METSNTAGNCTTSSAQGISEVIQMSQLYRTWTQFDQHIRQQGGPAEGVHQVQPENHLHEKVALVQTASLLHAMYHQ